MPRLWPRMAYEAPPGYVSFVERHLDELRRDAASVVGDENEADLLYPDVLVDVAARWRWLERRRRWLGRSGAAEAYLRRAFQRRSSRWRSRHSPDEQDPRVTFEGGPEIRVWGAHQPTRPVGRLAGRSAGVSSTALRLAPHLTPTPRVWALPVAEALVAWWHAYVAWRRRQVITALAAVFILLALGARTTVEVRGLAPVPERTVEATVR